MATVVELPQPIGSRLDLAFGELMPGVPKTEPYSRSTRAQELGAPGGIGRHIGIMPARPEPDGRAWQVLRLRLQRHHGTEQDRAGEHLRGHSDA